MKETEFRSIFIMERVELLGLLFFCHIYGILSQEIDCKRDVGKLEVGRRCHQPCRNNSDCESSSMRCLCDDWCGRSCFNPDQACDSLTPPQNGYITGSIRVFGHTVMYSCNSGYLLSGPPTRRCRSDGKWTGAEPSCVSFSTCGQSSMSGLSNFPYSLEKVVGGQKTPKGAWPWQVMIIHNVRNKAKESLYSLLGGGTVINRHWIISSAHNFGVFGSNNAKDWLHRVLFVVGISEIPPVGHVLPYHAQIYRGSDLKKHPKYKSSNYDYDIALIRVGERVISIGGIFQKDRSAPVGEIMFSEYVRPVCLPCINDRQNKTETVAYGGVEFKRFNSSICDRPTSNNKATAIVTGYGVTTAMKAMDLVKPERGARLRQGRLKILSTKKCIQGVNRIRLHVNRLRFTSRMLCAVSAEQTQKVDACVGDSGGPLLQQMKSRTGHGYWVQVGIVSWGWGCANTDAYGYTYPGYYTDVASVMEWVSGIILVKEKLHGRFPSSDLPKMDATPWGEVPVNVIHIKDNSENMYTIYVKSNSTIRDVKQVIEAVHNYPVRRQRIFFMKNLLSDQQTLDYYNIESGSFIYLSLRGS